MLTFMKTSLNYILLPKEITKAEENHLAKVNRISMRVCLVHLPVLAGTAFIFHNSVLEALIYGLMILSGPILGSFLLSNPRHLSIVYSIAFMCFGALLVHVGRGPMQIEMHFHFFVFVAYIGIFANPMAVLSAAATVAVHHLLFWLVLPASVFNYEASLTIIFAHATFLLTCAASTIYLARSYFDNVIELDKILIARQTSELYRKNQEMRLILDNTGEGFLMTTLCGNHQERSSSIDEWFDHPARSEKVWEMFHRVDRDVSRRLQLAFTLFQEATMPLDAILSQVPQAFTHRNRSFALSCKPILSKDDSTLENLLFIITDVTAKHAQEQVEKERTEILQIFENISRDEEGFIEFVAESDRILSEITQNTLSPPSERMLIHTLKGNCSVLGVTSMADYCHAIETRLLTENRSLSSEEKQLFAQRWIECRQRFQRFYSERGQGMQIDEESLARLMSKVEYGLGSSDVVKELASWRLIPARRHLARVAYHIQRMADVAQKEGIITVIEDNQLRFPKGFLKEFWPQLIHVVNNAIDHGIEDSEERRRKNKVESRIVLRTLQVAGELVIEISDNGRGIDWNRLKKKAAQAGVSSSNPVDLLFVDGLSSLDKATLSSGRGIGMSAVKQVCESLGGRIEVRSHPDEGTTFSFRFAFAPSAGPESHAA